eukprot:TRINITY_DN3354_c0_g1_i1.p1 TRINITY_DN3354_c0_g1~~TRINITY_DN3354_c0_g1_i1.p1  ORF type:complete len:177 (+),score=35.20 TRINITY_DN3354_c0_g1_i1:191-721(+)
MSDLHTVTTALVETLRETAAKIEESERIIIEAAQRKKAKHKMLAAQVEGLKAQVDILVKESAKYRADAIQQKLMLEEMQKKYRYFMATMTDMVLEAKNHEKAVAEDGKAIEAAKNQLVAKMEESLKAGNAYKESLDKQHSTCTSSTKVILTSGDILDGSVEKPSDITFATAPTEYQ